MCQHLFQAGLFHIEDFSFQRQNCLNISVSPGLCRAARRVTFYNEYLRIRLFLTCTVPQLARKVGSAQRTFAPGQFPCLPRSFSGCGSLDGLVQNPLRLRRMLFQKMAKLLINSGLNETAHFRIGQPHLRLGLKMWVGEFYCHHRC
ncbi:hypothetical protein ES703_82128 [subsurface metagenome]